MKEKEVTIFKAVHGLSARKTKPTARYFSQLPAIIYIPAQGVKGSNICIVIKYCCALTYSGKSHNTGSSFTNCLKDGSLAVLGDVMCHFKVTKCTTPLGMHHSLWDSLAIKVTHLIKKLNILEKDWAPGSNCHGTGLSVNRNTISSCKNIRFLRYEKKETGNQRS